MPPPPPPPLLKAARAGEAEPCEDAKSGGGSRRAKRPESLLVWLPKARARTTCVITLG